MKNVAKVQVPHYIEPDRHSSSAEYARRFLGPIGDYFLSVQREGVQAFLQTLEPQPLKILEVGGGHLQLTSMYLDSGADTVILGSAFDSFALASEKLKSDPRLQFVVGSLEKLPFDERSFDLVSAFRILPHIENTEAFIAELARVSRRAIVFDYASARSVNTLSPLFFRIKRRFEENTRPYFIHSPRKIAHTLRKCGFDPIYDFRQFTFPMVLFRTVGSGRFSRVLEDIARKFGITRRFGSPVIVGAVRSPNRKVGE